MAESIQTSGLDYALKGGPVAEGHNACSMMSEEIGIGGEDIKPCIAILFRDGCIKGFSELDRNTAGHLIAVELKRLSFGESENTRILNNWNKKNQPPMRISEIDSIVASAYRKPYDYGCHHPNLKLICIKKENCQFIQKGKGKYLKKVLWRDVMLKGWMLILSNPAKMIYSIALPELEYRRQVGPGNRIYVGYRDISSILGWKSHSRLKGYLEELAGFHLIEFIPGDPLRKNRKASEVTRIVPVPDVPELLKQNEG